MEDEKKILKKKEKHQGSPYQLYKLVLISLTRKPLNSRYELN
jgi:hypothetical protein